jgi:hypothetical protein
MILTECSSVRSQSWPGEKGHHSSRLAKCLWLGLAISYRSKIPVQFLWDQYGGQPMLASCLGFGWLHQIPIEVYRVSKVVTKMVRWGSSRQCILRRWWDNKFSTIRAMPERQIGSHCDAPNMPTRTKRNIWWRTEKGGTLNSKHRRSPRLVTHSLRHWLQSGWNVAASFDLDTRYGRFRHGAPRGHLLVSSGSLKGILGLFVGALYLLRTDRRGPIALEPIRIDLAGLGSPTW